MFEFYKMFGGISQEEVSVQLAKRDTTYDRYLIQDGSHPVAEELRRVSHIQNDLNVQLLGIDAIQKVYRFPNHLGASVIHGTFSMHRWEMAEFKFCNNFPRQRMPKKKRIYKKWMKQYSAWQEMVGEPMRTREFQQIESELLRIKNK